MPSFSKQLRRRHGFALLMMLVLLTIAAMAAVSISRVAISHMRAASEAELDLQRRWGMLSCQTILLPKTKEVIADSENHLKHPVISCKKNLMLGDLSFELTFGDESAKANVQTIVLQQGRQQAELTVRRLSLDSPTLAGSVYLRESDPKLGPQSFGEVFEKSSPSELCADSQGSSAVDSLTCWSDGRVNIHRVNETVLREIGNGILNLTQVNQLIALQQKSPTITLQNALNPLQLSQKNRTAAEKILSDSSNCYSLWINCQTKRRDYFALEVVDQSKPIWQYHHFEW
jgi:hypothetical protein